jgi:hypothetical protein
MMTHFQTQAEERTRMELFIRVRLRLSAPSYATGKGDRVVWAMASQYD